MEVNISSIKVISRLYPRKGRDKETVKRYKELYELGFQLPPLKIQKENKILVDGRHRLEALKELGKETVEIEELDISLEDIYLEAIQQ